MMLPGKGGRETSFAEHQPASLAFLLRGDGRSRAFQLRSHLPQNVWVAVQKGVRSLYWHNQSTFIAAYRTEADFQPCFNPYSSHKHG